MSENAALELQRARLGHPRLHLRRTGSSNERARALAQAGAPHGTLVTAAEQTAGRGRQGRRWSAPAGDALLLSLLLRDGARAGTPLPAPLALAAAVAVCDAVEQLGSSERPQIKWPNDIVLARSSVAAAGGAPRSPTLTKLAGILIEGRPQEGWSVLGIGLNAAVRVPELPPELHATAASLELPRAQIEPLLARLLRALERRLAEPAPAVLDAWGARDALRGRDVSWAAGRGRAAGIDAAGRLLVALPGGRRAALDAGEVHLAVTS
jgi:BirA family transcriptional regulator, biotin operon repressor / biotin---[acetyl-CoA-carboxylase] ligase